MALQLTLEYETLIELVDQLSEAQQQDLLQRLQEKVNHRELSREDKRALLNAMAIDLGEVSPDYSDRRADWYGDDSR
jgi:hypothetical protein